MNIDKNMEVENDNGSSIGTELEKSLEALKIGGKEVLARVTPDLDQVKDVDKTTPSGEDKVYDFVDIEPVELWQEETDKDAFTEEELINVLRSFEAEADVDEEEPLEFPEGEALPDLQLKLDDDALLLAPAEFTASIFDPPREPAPAILDSPSGDVKEIDVDKETDDEEEKKGEEEAEDDFGLSAALQSLNLDFDDGWENDQDLPPYLFCQPCTPVAKLEPFPFDITRLGSTAESQVLSNQAIDLSQFDKDRPKLPDKEFDALLQASLAGLDPYISECEMESMFEKGAAAGLADASTLANKEQQLQTPPPTPQEERQPMDQEMYVNVSQRREALEAAGNLLANFVANRGGLQNERSCFGHKETIFGTAFSKCGKYLASASQDSTVRLWDVATNTALSTLEEHSTEYECLRVDWASSRWGKDKLERGKDSPHSSLLATAGADGTVKIWASKDPKQKDSWTCCATIDHCNFDRIKSNPDDDKERPQVYALQWIDHWGGLPAADGSQPSAQNSFLLTSSDDFIHLWELEAKDDDSIHLSFREVMSMHFSSFQNQGYGVEVCSVTKTGLSMPSAAGQSQKGSASSDDQKAFGGERNPQNMIFVFDAAFSEANGLLGVALSDGTLRLINGRGICISIMSLPGCQSHLTSFAWDSTGTRVATCVATGHVILWGVWVHEGMGNVTTTCGAILEGGHEVGRPVFGSRFFSEGENLLLSWGVDGRLCVWDGYSQGNIHAPIATLVSKAEYPIYAVDVQDSCIAAGGGSETSFLGMPVQIYDTNAAGR